MDDESQILAEVFDSLIWQSTGKIPSEAGELFSLGLRLHNECPDVDPAFIRRLHGQVRGEEASEQRASGAGVLGSLLAILRPWRSKRAWPLRLAAIAVLATLLLPMVFTPTQREIASAGLGASIPAFEGVIIEERAEPELPPGQTKLLGQWSDLDEARSAAGFPLRVPACLPEGVSFMSAAKSRIDGRDRVILTYHGSAHDDWSGTEGPALLIQEYPILGTPTEAKLTFVFGPGSTEPLTIASRPAVFVKGSWSPGGRWSSGSPTRFLLLQDGDVVLQLKGRLDRAEMICIAESMLD